MAAADSSEDTGTLLGPVVCEVCGSDVASSVLVECCNFGEDHLVGCHQYCLAGHGVRGKKFEEYECLACKEYNRSVNDAVGRAHAGQEGSPEEMPELRRVQLGLRVRHGHEAKGHPTEQQRIDQAAAKAAKTRNAAEMDADHDAEDGNGRLHPSKRSRLGDKQAGAAAGAGQLQKRGSAAAAAAAAAGDGGGELSPPGRAGRKRQGTLQKFVKGVNTGKAFDVRQAQDRAKADKAAAAAAAAAGGVGAGRGRGRDRGRHEDREPTAAAAAARGFNDDDQNDGLDWEVHPAYDHDDEIPAAAESERKQEQRQQQQQQAGIRMGRHHKLGLTVQVAAYEQQLMKAKLHCRLIVLPKEGQEPVRQQDLHDPENYLHVSGQFWTSEDLEEAADAQQQEAHKQLLADMASELMAQGTLTLMGGAFDLATHPAIQHFMEDPQISYKPLLFIVNTDTDKRMVKDLLSDPRRFVVMSIESKLLVLLPTNTGHLVSVCVREFARSDDFTNEVVKTIMAHPTLGCPSQEADGNQLQSPSESLLGPPNAVPVDTHHEDVKDGILQQQEQQHLHRAQSQAGETSGIAGQQRLQQEQQLQVQHLPAGMRSGHDDLHDAAARLIPALAAVAAGAQAAAGGPLAQAATAVMAAAAAAAAAAAGGGVLPSAAAAGAAGSSLSVPEFVQGSPLAHLLKVEAGAADQQQQQQQQDKQVLTLRSCIPQLVDLAELQHLRLFVVGFPQDMLEEGGRLFNCLTAARKLVEEVHSGARAMDELLQDLHLQVVPPRPGSPVFFTAQGSLPGDATAAAAAASAANGAEGVSETRRRSGELDLTDGPQDSCYRVLLVPEHFGSQALQQLLGQVPLWRLLACPVAIFRQGPNRGILQELQRLQKQQAATAAGAGSRAAAGVDAGNGSGSSLRVPPGIALTTQLYKDELAVVADAIALKHCTVEVMQQLMQLLRQAQTLLHAQWDAAAGLTADNPVYLAITQQDMDKLGEEQQELLKSGLSDNTVVLLDELLAPAENGTASSIQDDADPVVAAAAKLAAQRRQQLRHVIVVAPDVGDSLPSAPRLPLSNGAAAAAAASPVKSLSKHAAASSPLQVSKGGSRGAGSGGLSAQKRADAYEARALAGLRFKGAAQNPRLLAGTVGQTLQFLEFVVENSSKAAGEQ